MKLNNGKVSISISANIFGRFTAWMDKNALKFLLVSLTIISITSYIYYYQNGLGLAYNDARSHLDIGRRVVEGLKPGIAQLGSVWLPLTHFLMITTIWNDFMWHSGLAGAIWSMIAFIGTGILIYNFLKELGVELYSRMIGVTVFVANINILYLQSTAMTELLLLFTMTAGAYYLMLWYKKEKLYLLLLSAFWIMASTLVRYDGWFLFVFVSGLLLLEVWKNKGYKTAEGMFLLFCTLGGYGIFLWLLWNQLIFKDMLYFIYGPYSAHSQQLQLEEAGVLATKHNWLFSTKIYLYALAYNSGAFTMVIGTVGAVSLWFDKRIKPLIRWSSLALFAPLLFNILALYLGHSVLYIAGLSGDTWFNVRYGIMMMPSFAIFIGYLFSRVKGIKPVLTGLLLFTIFFSFTSADAVTIDDALIGSSQKNVTEVSGWLSKNTIDKPGFILISVASHDAIIFSSGLPMKKFIHEGTGKYYESAISDLDKWARWIVVRTYSMEDSTWRAIMENQDFYKKYTMVDHYPFADIYELKNEYIDGLITEPIYGDLK